MLEFKVLRHDKFRRDWSQHFNICKPEMARTTCPEKEL